MPCLLTARRRPAAIANDPCSTVLPSRLLPTLTLLALLPLAAACGERAEEPRPTEPPRRVTLIAQSVPLKGAEAPATPAAPVSLSPTPGLPPDLAGTATSLYRRLNETAPPPPAMTGGGPPAGDATPAPPPPNTGGGPGLDPPPPNAFWLGAEGPHLPYRSLGALQRYAPFNPHHAEAYAEIVENHFHDPGRDPLSTLSIDVDTASYSNVRRWIETGQWPPADAVRLEELVNYFGYDDPLPPLEDPAPFAVNVEVATSPWSPENRLVRVGLRGREIDRADRPPVNLVFLIDVSGSMGDPNKLPLVQDSLRLLTGQLEARDRVAMVVYAGAAGLVLPSTRGNAHAKILDAIDRLQAGGSTNGGAGIQLAYDTALDHFIEGGVNRVVLCTDGDFNVGLTDPGALTDHVAERAAEGVALTAVGFGMGNYKDDTMERLSNRGDGNYAYIDSEREAEKVFADEVMGTLVTIARDVKLQVEFNPVEVGGYRLLGYENRVLATEDFNDDAVDAGEVGAGHTLTVLYEISPPGAPLPRGDRGGDVDRVGEDGGAEAGAEGEAGGAEGEEGQAEARGEGDAVALPPVDPLRFQEPMARTAAADSGELLAVKVRWKDPEVARSTLLTVTAFDYGLAFDEASDDLRFAAAVAAFGMVLRDSAYRGEADLPSVLDIARASLGADAEGLRADFLSLAEQALLLREEEQALGSTGGPPGS